METVNSNIKTKLMSKIGYVATQLAKELLLKEKEEKINTVGEYAQRFDIGRGTVQSALNFLQDNEAIKLEKRGHLGTFIKDSNYNLLWKIADLGAIVGVMPLPYSSRYEGLATGLNKIFNQVKLPFDMAFMRGAKNRLDVLKDQQYSFAIVSKFAADLVTEDCDDYKVIYDFGENSYLSKHVVIFSDQDSEQIESGMKVGIDSSSIDHQVLTELECEGLDVEFIELTYMQIIEHINQNKIDAAVWNYDSITSHSKNLNFSSLHNPCAIEKNKEISRAVMIINQKNRFIEGLINKFIDLNQIIEIQNKIMNHELIPEY